MKQKKLSIFASVYNTRPLMALIHSYAKTKDIERKHITAKLLKHFHFLRPSLVFKKELVIYDGINFNKIVFPRRMNTCSYNI